MSKKETWTGFEVRRSDWSGDDDLVGGPFHSYDEAVALADRCNRESRAVDDRRDRVHYGVHSFTYTTNSAK